jgi:hypothetical protein
MTAGERIIKGLEEILDAQRNNTLDKLRRTEYTTDESGNTIRKVYEEGKLVKQEKVELSEKK